MQSYMTDAIRSDYKGRAGWIDVWKGLLIFQIVVFHVLGAANVYVPNASSGVVKVLSSFIENYHVTAFFVVAGLLWRGGINFRMFVSKKAFRLLVPYIVFGLFWAMLYVLLSHVIGGAESGSTIAWSPFASVLLCNGWPQGEGWRVINALWFLPCMFLTSICYWLIDKTMPKFWQQVVVLLVLNGLEHHSVVLLPWAAERIPRMLIFVIIGRWVGKIFDVSSRRLCLALSVALYTISSFRPIVSFLCDWFGLGAWRFVVQSFLAIAASGFLSRAISQSRFLEYLGKSSLVILCLHKLPILLIQAIPPVMALLYGSFAWPASLVLVSVMTAVLSLQGAYILRRLCPAVIGEKRVD